MNEYVEARPSSGPDKATRVQRGVSEVAEVSRKTSGGSTLKLLEHLGPLGGRFQSKAAGAWRQNHIVTAQETGSDNQLATSRDESAPPIAWMRGTSKAN